VAIPTGHRSRTASRRAPAGPSCLQTLSTADVCLLVVDLADPDCLQHLATVQAELARRKATLVTRWPADPTGTTGDSASAGAARQPRLVRAGG
jgi:uncharacterized protein